MKRPESRNAFRLLQAILAKTLVITVFCPAFRQNARTEKSTAPGAFSRSLAANDVRALINHDTTLVTGRTKAGTLTLREDEHGLWGDILINPKDQDSLNAWARVERGDVDQASFGFDIVSEETEIRADGAVHWTITEVVLHEVSVCTFPAYKETNVSVREEQRRELSEKRLNDWKQAAMTRIHKED